MMLDDEEIAADKEMFRVISWAMQLAHYRDDLGRARKWLDQGGFDVLPPEVRNYLIDLLFNFEHAIRERPRQLTCGGQARPERDRVIVFAIDTVREVFRLHEKRSVASKDKDKKESACSIVFKALGLLNVGHGLTEAAVNTIWDKHKRRSKKLRE
jgi:hypothetical protein